MTEKLQKGRECLINGQFFDAHEHWEIPWMEMCGHVRSFWQAMIQLSVGAHHFEKGNLTGCRNLWGKALRHCNRLIAWRMAGEEAMVRQLRDVLCDCLQQAESGGNPLALVQDFARSTMSEHWFEFW